MDPLSITATVAGFISFVGDAIDYFNDFKGAKDDRDDLIERLHRLEDELRSIESRVTHINRAKDEAFVGAFGRTRRNDKLFRRYEEAERSGGRFDLLFVKLGHLFNKEFQKELSKWKELRLRASWKWKKDEKKSQVDEIVERARSLREFLSDDDAEMQHETFLGVRRIERTNEELEIVQILNWISPAGQQPTDFLASKHSTIRYIPDPFITTQVYDQWTADAGARNWHLSCYGDPGTGKSHRSRTVIWDLSHRYLSQGVPVLFVLFNHQNRSNQSLKSVYCMLLRQILSQSTNSDIPNQIRDAWNRTRLDGSTSPSENEAKNFLFQELKKHSKKFVVADALDEAGDSAGAIHTALSDLRRDTKVCIFSTSRQNPRKVFSKDRRCDGCNAQIEGLSWQCNECTGSMFAELEFCPECYLNKNARCKFPTHRMNIPEQVYVHVSPSPNDIEFFVEKSLQKELDLDDTGDEDQLLFSSYAPMLLDIKHQFGPRWTTIPKEITKAAGDSYLIADLIVKRLIAQVTFADAEAIMNGLQMYSGNSWNSQYTEMLNLCFDEDDPEGRKVAYDHLSLVYCAHDVLSFEQLSHAVAIKKNDRAVKNFLKRRCKIQTVRNKTHGLLSIGDFGNPDDLKVSFFHRTLSTYLEEHGTTWFPDAHETMFNSCLAYLQLDIFQQPFRNLKELDKTLGEYPFASYAACNWGEHLRRKSLSSADVVDVLEIFNDQLRTSTILQIALHTFSRTDHAWDVSGQISPLHVCAFFGLDELCQVLLNDGENVNVQEADYGQAPIHYAARRGHVDTVKYLLSAGADANIASSRGLTPLMEAIESSRFEAIDVLLADKFVDVNASGGGIDGKTALTLAAESGQTGFLAKLLGHDEIDINKPDGMNVSALARALRCPSLECVDMLLNHPDIDLDIRDKKGTPLENVSNLYPRAVEPILEKIVKSFFKHSKCSPIGGQHLAHLIEYQRYTMVGLFLAKFRYETWKDDNGRTIMHIAAGVDRRAFELVHEHFSQASSFDISTPDKHGNTPLHTACLRFVRDKGKTAEFLLAHGAPPLLTNLAGDTPLDIACQSSPTTKIKDVLSIFEPYIPPGFRPSAAQSDPTLAHIIKLCTEDDLVSFLDRAPQDLAMLKDPYSGRTPLHVTVQRKRSDLLSLLLPRAHQYIDTASNAGRTPLHDTVLYGFMPGVEILLSAGANPNLKDKWNETPFDLAQKNKDAGASALLLINSGADLPPRDKIKKDLIHEAVVASNIDAVQKLIKAEVDLICRKNVTGLTPLALARDTHSLAVGKATNDITADLATRSSVDMPGFWKLVNETPKVKASQQIVDLLQDAIDRGMMTSDDHGHDIKNAQTVKVRVKHRDLNPLIQQLKRQAAAGLTLEDILNQHRRTNGHKTLENGVHVAASPPYDKAISSSHDDGPSHESDGQPRDKSTASRTLSQRSPFNPQQGSSSGSVSKEEKITAIVMVGVVIVAWMWLNIHYQTNNTTMGGSSTQEQGIK